MKVTYDLLADGIVQVIRALAAIDGMKAEVWAKKHELEDYSGSSIRGESGINRDDDGQRREFLKRIVVDAEVILEKGRRAQAEQPQDRK